MQIQSTRHLRCGRVSSRGLREQDGLCVSVRTDQNGRSGSREPASGTFGSPEDEPRVRSLAVSPQVEEAISEERTL